MIGLAEPTLGDAEKKALCDAIDSQWLSSGPRVEAFEQAFALLHGFKDAVGVSSCTAALHLALQALGVGPGDEVLVPALSFVATVNPVLYLGATPVFVDIESLHRPHMNLKDAARKRTSKTKAAVIMHYGGYIIETQAWERFGREYGVAIVEDAAHAPGMPKLGEHSSAAVFSFFPNKNMTTAEGGMLLSKESELLNLARIMRNHGMTKSTLDRRKGHAFSYDVIELGYNYRLDELRAALGLVQLERLSSWNARRRDLIQRYRDRLSMRSTSNLLLFDHETPTSGHLMAVLLPEGVNRSHIMTAMLEKGIPTSIHYPAITTFEYYKRRFGQAKVELSEMFASRVLTLPLYPQLREQDVDSIVDILCDELQAEC